ncbi:MAG TPA: GNAT family N-acetyltransferase, partial [Acidimicrobiales bacterium]
MDRSLALSSPRTAGRLGPTHSARLELTPVSFSHRDSLAAVFAKEEVWRFPFGRGLTGKETAAFVESQVEHWDTLGFGLWVATVHGRDAPIGVVGLSVPEFLPEVL